MRIGAATVTVTCALAGSFVILSPGLVRSAAAAAAGSNGQSDDTVLQVNSPATEPAVPLNLSLKVRVLAAERAIEIIARVSKRSGYPADMFFDQDVTAKMTLPSGLQLEEGSLNWSGTLKGNQIGEFAAKVKALRGRS